MYDYEDYDYGNDYDYDYDFTNHYGNDYDFTNHYGNDYDYDFSDDRWFYGYLV